MRPPGVDLTYVVLSPRELGLRVTVNAEFDAGELWAASHVCLVARGDNAYVGIPVFPSRAFRHGNIFVNTSAGIVHPTDLVGRRVAVSEFHVTAAVWARAVLQHDHGVLPTDVDWVVTPERFHARVDVPAGLRSTVTPPGADLEALLLAGDVDAYLSPSTPPSLGTDARIGRLFPDHVEREREYFRRTGLFPIMHLVGLRRDVYEQHRWLPNALVRAFEEAKQMGRSRLRHDGALAVGLPHLPAAVEESDAVFGPDPFRYGLAANYAAVDALTQYVHEQGLSARKVAPEELFAPETLDVDPTS